jgi:RNA polymerase sigma-70 factor (ECF subfamily)
MTAKFGPQGQVEDLSTTLMRQLVSRHQHGDAAATDELLRRTSARIQGIARRMLHRFPGVRRWEQSEDVVQNATLRLLRALRQMRPDTLRSFYWLAAEQIRRELLDLARLYYGPLGLGKHHDGDLRLEGDGGELMARREPAAPAESPEEAERWAAFHEAVARLPPEEREVFGLTFYHGWGQKEIGELLRKGERTVRRRWRSAMMRLHDLLEGQLPPGAV